MNPEIIEAMCRAYWNERGSFKWENEGEQYKETIRGRMRTAKTAADDMYRQRHEQRQAGKLIGEPAATKSVPAPGIDPNHVLFSKPPLHSMAHYAEFSDTLPGWAVKKP